MPADLRRRGGTHTALWRQHPTSEGPLCLWEEAGGSPPTKHPDAADPPPPLDGVFWERCHEPPVSERQAGLTS